MSLLSKISTVFLLTMGCGSDSAPQNSVDTGFSGADYGQVSFTDEIAPLFRSNCALSGCHAGDGKKALIFRNGQASTDTELFAALMRESSKGNPLIDPARPSNSQIVIRIEAENRSMPPLQRLPLMQRNDIRFWIAQGAISGLDSQ